MIKNIFVFMFAILLSIGSCFTKVSFAQDQSVIVNIKRHVYHKMTCNIGKRCKKTCIHTRLARALSIYHARPCKVCYKKGKKHK